VLEFPASHEAQTEPPRAGLADDAPAPPAGSAAQSATAFPAFPGFLSELSAAPGNGAAAALLPDAPAGSGPSPAQPVPAPSGASAAAGAGGGVAAATLFALLVSLAAFGLRHSTRLRLASIAWRQQAFVAVIERPG
jgi:hypothetical protein